MGEDACIHAGSVQKKIPNGRYEKIYKKQQASLFHRNEAKVALKYLVEKGYDPDTSESTLDAIIDKIIKATRLQVTAELMEENWRAS